MNIEFAISGWSAYAAGLDSPARWQEWASQPFAPAGEDAPALSAMPAMLRRRLGLTGRMAVQVAYDATAEASGAEAATAASSGTPIVFASRYGDAIRSLNLLGEFAAGEAVSPTDFALSVHNAIGAMYSIARQDSANYSAVAGGAATAAAGVVEAVALLDDGAAEVMLVCYDTPLPGDYRFFDDEAPAAWAWAWRLRKPLAGEACITLQASAAAVMDVPPAGHAQLPFGLDVLRFALSDEPLLERSCDGTTWSWKRQAANAATRGLQ